MADFYKILKADPLGDPWTPKAPGAKPIQNYWCQVEGQEKAVSIGKQVGNTLTPGQHVYGDLKYAKSQKGTEYWKFDSQMVPEGIPRPADSPAQATAQQATGSQPNSSAVMPEWFMPVANQIDYIFREMKKVDSSVVETKEEPFQESLITEDDVIGEPMPQDAIDALNGVFNEPEPPEEK